MKIVWDKSLSVGVGVLDYQHRKIIGLINELCSNINTEFKDSYILQDLFESIEQHLIFEEEVLVQYKYPEIKEHIKQHKYLLEETQMLNKLISSEEKIDKEILQKYIQGWIDDHLKNEANDLYAFFKDINIIEHS